jgi:ABC-2 type transport system permease protein
MSVLYQAWAFLRRDYLLARLSRLQFAWQVLTVAFATPTMYYLGRLIRPGGSPALDRFGGDYFAFVVLGVAFLGFLITTMGACATAIRNEQASGTLDVLLCLPVPLPALALGMSLWAMLVAAGQAALYLSFGAWFFRLDFSHANLLGFTVVLTLSVAAVAALGILSAALVVATKQWDPLTGIVASASALLGGVFYPIEVLPRNLQVLAWCLPITPALRGMRLALLRGDGLVALRAEVFALAAFTAVVAPVALLAFRWALDEARRSGMLAC